MVETTSRAKSHTSQQQQQQRSLSPSGRFCSSSISSSSSSAFTAQSRPTFYYNSPQSTTTLHHHRSSSPTRVSLAGLSSPTSSSSVYFSIDRPTSPVRSFSVNKIVKNKQIGTASHHHQLPSRQPKKTCMCSPTTHPGSFRCSFHKAKAQQQQQQQQSYQPHRLNMRRSAMTNSLVRIGTVEGEWVKRALATLIRPSSHHQRRRGDFQPRPSRLCIMSKAEDL